MTLYEADTAFEELIDKAKKELPPSHFTKFLDDVDMIMTDYEETSDDE